MLDSWDEMKRHKWQSVWKEPSHQSKHAQPGWDKHMMMKES